jgi:hypothetical protein
VGKPHAANVAKTRKQGRRLLLHRNPLLVEVRHSHSKTNMEGKYDVSTLEVGLVIQVGRAANHPPAMRIGMNVPDVVPDVPDHLGRRVLNMDYSLRRLSFDIGADFVLISLAA